MELIHNPPPDAVQAIESYGEGGFRVSGVVHTGSVMVLPQRTIAWPVATVADLTIDSLSPLMEHDPPIEILLLGCGQAMSYLGTEVREAMREHGIAVDSMTTAAACRTYNLLLGDDRAVAAALIAVD